MTGRSAVTAVGLSKCPAPLGSTGRSGPELWKAWQPKCRLALSYHYNPLWHFEYAHYSPIHARINQRVDAWLDRLCNNNIAEEEFWVLYEFFSSNFEECSSICRKILFSCWLLIIFSELTSQFGQNVCIHSQEVCFSYVFIFYIYIKGYKGLCSSIATLLADLFESRFQILHYGFLYLLSTQICIFFFVNVYIFSKSVSVKVYFSTDCRIK